MGRKKKVDGVSLSKVVAAMGVAADGLKAEREQQEVIEPADAVSVSDVNGSAIELSDEEVATIKANFPKPLSAETEKPYLDEGEEKVLGQDDALEAVVLELGSVTMEKVRLEKKLLTANHALQMALTLMEKHFTGHHIETVLREALGLS